MDPRELESEIVARWDFADPETTMEVMADASRADDVSVAEGLVWLTQAARAAGLQGEIESALEALAILDRAVAYVPDGAGRHHVLARIAIERGRLHNTDDRPADARPWFDIAYDEARAAGTDGLAVDALHMSAIVVGRLDGPEAARDWNTRALALAESSDDPTARRWRASLLNNLAWDLHDAGDAAGALPLFEQALDVRRQEGDAVATQVAEWSVARVLRTLERYDEALAVQQRLATEQPGADDGYVHEEIGECLLALGRPAEAGAAFGRAHALLSEDRWIAEHEPARLARLGELAQQG